MEKPISIRVEDTLSTIRNCIITSGLPCWILESGIRAISEEVSVVAKKERSAERAEYEKTLANESEKVEAEVCE